MKKLICIILTAVLLLLCACNVVTPPEETKKESEGQEPISSVSQSQSESDNGSGGENPDELYGLEKIDMAQKPFGISYTTAQIDVIDMYNYNVIPLYSGLYAIKGEGLDCDYDILIEFSDVYPAFYAEKVYKVSRNAKPTRENIQKLCIGMTLKEFIGVVGVPEVIGSGHISYLYELENGGTLKLNCIGGCVTEIILNGASWVKKNSETIMIDTKEGISFDDVEQLKPYMSKEDVDSLLNKEGFNQSVDQKIFSYYYIEDGKYLTVIYECYDEKDEILSGKYVAVFAEITCLENWIFQREIIFNEWE